MTVAFCLLVAREVRLSLQAYDVVWSEAMVALSCCNPVPPGRRRERRDRSQRGNVGIGDDHSNPQTLCRRQLYSYRHQISSGHHQILWRPPVVRHGSPENWFEDFGGGQLMHGHTTVKINPIFSETVSTQVEHHVFLTPKGDCNSLFVANQSATAFEVRELQHGTSTIEFDYRVVAKRKGYEHDRLAGVEFRTDTLATEAKLAAR